MESYIIYAGELIKHFDVYYPHNNNNDDDDDDNDYDVDDDDDDDEPHSASASLSRPSIISTNFTLLCFQLQLSLLYMIEKRKTNWYC